MTVERLEAELRDVEHARATLKEEMSRLSVREEEAKIALRVLVRLTPPAITPVAPPPLEPQSQASTATETSSAPQQVSVQCRGRQEASAAIAAAGPAAIEILQSESNFIKPTVMVERLASEYGIFVGLGKPGRKTSDLSAAIGHGKVPGLEVTRGRGWGLTDWNGTPPSVGQVGHPELADVGSSALQRLEEAVERNVSVRSMADEK